MGNRGSMTAEWWYRTLGEEFGPTTLDIVQSLYVAGTLTADDLVRKGASGTWQLLQDVPELRNLQANAHAESPPPDDRPPSAEQSPTKFLPVQKRPPEPESATACAAADSAQEPEEQPFDGGNPLINQAMRDCVRQLTARHGKQVRARKRTPAIGAAVGRFFALLWMAAASVFRGPWRVLETVIAAVPRKIVLGTAVAGVLVAASVLLWPWLQVKRYSMEAIHQALVEVGDEVHRLRDSNAEESEWERFAEQARALRGEIIPPLEALARVENSASMDLLWAARDYLPSLLDEVPETEGPSERQFRFHVDRAGRAIRQNSPPTGVMHVLLYGLTALNVLICLMFLKRFATGSLTRRERASRDIEQTH